ncbi:hypothetical protein [Streptomyces venezuelae]|uniref:hypothetical protein n=1 Tax=Streptomyces venezuelae TaxID=54571 RepID=UPI0037981C85
MCTGEGERRADASGTCEGVPGLGGRVSRAWESASGESPVEVCVVAGERPELPGPAPSDETPRYHLTAFYGPYAVSERLAHERRHGKYTEEPGPADAPAGRLAGGGRWARSAGTAAAPPRVRARGVAGVRASLGARPRLRDAEAVLSHVRT